MNIEKIQNIFFFSLLVLGLGFSLYLLYPFLESLSLALVLAIIFKPLYRDILKTVGGRKNIASITTIVFIFIIIVVPLVFALSSLFTELRQIYTNYLVGGGEGKSMIVLPNLVSDFTEKNMPWLNVDLEAIKGQAASWILSSLSSIFSSAFNLILGLFIIILGLFYLFRDGHHFRERLTEISPLKENDDDKIIKKVEETINSVIRGSIFIGVIQGTLVGIGFAIFGIPEPFLWGMIAAVAALIPSVGTAIISIPGIAFLFLSQQYIPAIGLTIWSVVLVSMIDNLLAPYLIGRGIKIHQFFVFLSVIGGLKFFGPIGFIVGPIVLSLSITLIDIYSSLLKNDKKDI